MKLNSINKIVFTLIFLLITFATTTKSYSQNKSVIIKGKILEEDTLEPLEGATIIFSSTTSNAILGEVSKEDGTFWIRIPKGVYDMSVEFISFKTKYYKNQTFTANKDFGDINLDEASERIDEVVIKATKTTVELHLDKKIYNLGSDISTRGASAIDALDNVPSLNIDIEGNVSLRDNDNVKILINGRPSGLAGVSANEALRNLPADAIEKVEIITSPSARYDAEGSAGIINIILKKGAGEGFNGNISVDLGNPDIYGIGTSVNYKTEKFNVFTNNSFKYRLNKSKSTLNQENLENEFDNHFLYENKNSERKNNSITSNSGVEYNINPNHSVSGSFLFYQTHGDRNELNASENYAIDNSISSIIHRNNTSDFTNKSTEYNLNYLGTFDNNDDHKLTFDFQYTDTKDFDDGFIINDLIENNIPVTLVPNEQNINDERQKQYLIQTDYNLPIGKKSQFEAGFKSTLTDNLTSYDVFFENDNGDFIKDFDISSTLNYKENIYAFYTQFGSKIEKFSYLLGIRTEITNIEIIFQNESEASKDYTKWFPTLNLGYELSDTD